MKNDPAFFDISTSESGSCSGDNECSVLFPLLSWFPQFQEACCMLRLHLLSLLVWLSSLLPSSPSIRPDNELDELQSQSDFPSPARSLRSRQSILPFPAGEPVPDTAKSVLAALKSAVKSDFASKTSSVTKSVISCFL